MDFAINKTTGENSSVAEWVKSEQNITEKVIINTQKGGFLENGKKR